MGLQVIGISTVGTVAVVLVIAGLVPLHRAGGVDEWALDRGLRLTDASRPMVGYYLRTARMLRFVGAVAGLVLPSLAAMAWNGHRDSVSTLSGVAWAYAGYLVGSLYAEVAVVRPSGQRRAASLLPRSLGDYLPAHRLAVLGQRAIGDLRRPAYAAAALGLVASPTVCRWFSHRPFRVRRLHRPEVVGA